MICFTQHERLNKEDHKTRTGIEPASSDNRSAALPIKLPDHHLSYTSNYISNTRSYKYWHAQDNSDQIDFSNFCCRDLRDCPEPDPIGISIRDLSESGRDGFEILGIRIGTGLDFKGRDQDFSDGEQFFSDHFTNIIFCLLQE
jgi:hypothetical protein